MSLAPIALARRFKPTSSARPPGAALLCAVMVAALGVACNPSTATPTFAYTGSDAPTLDAGVGDAASDLGGDAAEVDPDSAPDADADTGCAAGAIGSAESPAPLPDQGTLTDLALCPGEQAWFGARLNPSDHALLRVADPGEALEVRVWGAGETPLAMPAPVNGVHSVSLVATGVLPLRLEVTNTSAELVSFGVEATITRDPDACAEEPGEPNDNPVQATPLPLNATVEGTICGRLSDWYAVDLDAERSLTLVLGLQHEVGDLDMRLFEVADPEAEPVATSETATDEERAFIAPSPLPRRVFVEVYGYRGALGAYTLQSLSFGPGEGVARVEGSFRYEDRVFDEGGFTGEIALLPARGLAVEVVREGDGAPVARGLTDEAGGFAVEAPIHAGQRYSVRGLAEVEVGPNRATVRDRSAARALYAVVEELGPLTDGEVVSGVALVAGAERGAGGAVNIADVVGGALRMILAFDGRAAPALTFSWQPGEAFDCGSCFSRSSSTISLGGQLEDPDEYDDDIVLHEFGHYFVAHWSRDSSPGGTHRDRRVEPTLAYGEGVAYFLAAMWRGGPIIVDNFFDARRAADLDALTINGEPVEDIRGTATGQWSGRQREELVAGILWDALDPADDPAEPFDRVEIGVAGHMAVLLSGLGAEEPPVDVGPDGIDIVDWLAAAECAQPGLLAALAPALEELEAPALPDGLEAACAGKGAERLVAVEARGDGLWLVALKAGEGLELDPRWQLTVREPGRSEQRATLACAALPCPLGVQGAPSRVVVVTGAVEGRWAGASWRGDVARSAWLKAHPRVRANRAGLVRELKGW